ncbi:hypothetical protein [Endozoicomonas atrinae]|uniref:hypothetical protein n=1 Tax=Endozoicomonas atrinae TaxID=1333660 RepID=UPI003AFFF89D
MDRMTNIYASAATYKQPVNGHDADRLLTTPQLVSPTNMKPSQRTNLSERTVSLMVTPLQQKASLSPTIPLPHIKTEVSHPDEGAPLLPQRHNRAQLVDEFTSLWQQITETNVLKNFIITLFFPNRVNELARQLTALTLTYDEQLQTLTNFYVIKFREHPNRAIQSFRNDRKSVEHHLRATNHPLRAPTLPAVLNQVEACINDSFDIKRHLTNLSQSHYSMSMDDPEHKELDECNMHLQTEHQNDLKISSSIKLSVCFSNDLLRGMNVALYSPLGHVLLRIYGNTKTCSYEESEESGVILDQMTFDTDNLTDLDTREQEFQARIKARLFSNSRLLNYPLLKKLVIASIDHEYRPNFRSHQ